MNELLVKAGGIYNLLFIVFHLLFWRLFDWNNDLRSLSFVNRAVMQVLNISLTIVFMIFCYLSLVHTRELLTTPVGHALLLLIALFWFARAIQQVVFFKLRHWASWAFTTLFLLGAVLYGIPAYFVL